MFKNSNTKYSIKTCPSNDVEQLEALLNEMAQQGWDLLSLHETEDDESELVYNCIFMKENIEDSEEDTEIVNIKEKMERMLSIDDNPFEHCKNVQQKIKDVKNKISKTKELLDCAENDEKYTLNDKLQEYIEELNASKKELNDALSTENMTKFLGEERITIVLSEELVDLVNGDEDGYLISHTVKLRHELTNSIGYIIPKITFEHDEMLEPNQYAIKIRGIKVFDDFVYPSHSLYYKEDLDITKSPKNSILSVDKVSKKKIIWIDNALNKNYWIKGLSASEFIMKMLEHIVIYYIEDIFDYNDVNRYVEFVTENNSFLVDNIIPDFITVSELKYLLTCLIKERVSVKDIIFVFEKINDLSDDDDKQNLLDKLRVSLSSIITKNLLGDSENLKVFTVSEKTVNYINSQITRESEIVRISQDTTTKIINKLNKTITQNKGLKNIIIIAPTHIRHILFVMLSKFFNNIFVVTREELSLNVEIEILGEI